MNTVHLTGQLVCEDLNQFAIVAQHLPLHIELTRAEQGCLSFEVDLTQSLLVWQVDEHFKDAESFQAHQQRVAASEWGRTTAGIERRYKIRGV